MKKNIARIGILIFFIIIMSYNVCYADVVSFSNIEYVDIYIYPKLLLTAIVLIFITILVSCIVLEIISKRKEKTKNNINKESDNKSSDELSNVLKKLEEDEKLTTNETLNNELNNEKKHYRKKVGKILWLIIAIFITIMMYFACEALIMDSSELSLIQSRIIGIVLSGVFLIYTLVLFKENSITASIAWQLGVFILIMIIIPSIIDDVDLIVNLVMYAPILIILLVLLIIYRKEKSVKKGKIILIPIISVFIIGVLILGYKVTESNNEKTYPSFHYTETTSYNQEWLAYEGTITGINAKALCTAVISHNNNEDDDSYMIRVLEVTSDLEGEEVDDGETSNTTTSEITSVRTGLVSGSKYYISFNYTSNGLIKEIGIRELDN